MAAREKVAGKLAISDIVRPDALNVSRESISDWRSNERCDADDFSHQGRVNA